MTEHWEEDLVVHELCEAISGALRDNHEHIVVGWKQTLASRGEGRDHQRRHAGR